MPSPFTGASFSLKQIVQNGPATLRVTFTNDPLASDPAGVNDGLNPANYALTGPSTNQIDEIQTVSADPQSVDLLLAAPLTDGLWTLAVSNVQTATANPLTAPTSLNVLCELMTVTESLAQGAENDDAETLLRKFLSPALKGRGWDALLAAIATGDTYNEDLAKNAFDQMYKSTASGVYLDRRAANDGYTRPAGIGISDDIFRNLAIKVTARKQVIQVILEALEAYYGSEATRAHSTSSTYEPFALDDGDQLLVQVDGKRPVYVSFERDDFTQMGTATAAEVVAAITRSFRAVGSQAYAVVYNDPSLNRNFVRIYSQSLGLGGNVRVLGGRSQNVFKFPTEVHPSGGPVATTEFTITPGTGVNGILAGRVRFEHSAGADPDLGDVWDGDYVNLFGSVFAADLQGTYTVAAVTPDYFEITSTKTDWAASVTLLATDDVRFFRPTLRTIHSAGRLATATQGDPSVLDVILPATTQAVAREQNTAAYLHSAQAVAITAASRDSSGVVTVTAADHGLVTGQQAFIDGLYPNNTLPTPTLWSDADPDDLASAAYAQTLTKLTNGKILQVSDTLCNVYDETTNSWDAVAVTNFPRTEHTAVLLNSGKVLVAGGSGFAIDQCELYDVATDTWSPTGDLNDGRARHASVLLNDGRVMVIGGENAGAVTSCEIYDPGTGLWTVTASFSGTHSGGVRVVKLNDGRVVVIGGGSKDVEVYNPLTDSWETADSIPSGTNLEDHSAILLDNGNVFVCGGEDGTGVSYPETFIFKPSTYTWVAGPDMSTPRAGHGFLKFDNGHVLVVAGFDAAGATQDTTEIYDYTENTWRAGPDLLVARDYSQAVLLSSSKKALMHGDGTVTAFAELYSSPDHVIAAGGLNGQYEVTVLGATQFTYETPEAPYETVAVTTDAVVTSARGGTNDIAGPFIYDTSGSPAVTETESTLTSELVVGSNYTVMQVADASDFPDEEGWICFAFGTESQVSPVKYLGRISSTHLLIDPSFTFPNTLAVGSTVTLLAQRGIFVPDQPEDVGSFYITAAAAGRVAAANTIEELIGAGLAVNTQVVYPSDFGLGNEGEPASGASKLSDKVVVWAGDDVDEEIEEAREE